jgi:transcriptional regulator GlxA family with amidase domain
MTVAAILALAVVALAGIDLALAMIERDLGVAMARAVARQLVVCHRCAGG